MTTSPEDPDYHDKIAMALKIQELIEKAERYHDKKEDVKLKRPKKEDGKETPDEPNP